jgi:hypothetical protein
MSWTKDKPTQPGYYWYRRHMNQDVRMLLVEIARMYPRYKDELMASYTTHEYEPMSLETLDGEWQGPLEVPQ